METTIDTVTVDLGDHTNYNLFPLPIRSSTNKSNNISKNISNSIQTDICKMTKLLVIISFLLMAVIPFKRSLDQDQYNLFNYLIIWNVIFRSITLLLSNISIKRSFIYSSIVIIIIYFSLWYAMPNPAGTAWTFRVLSTFAYCLILVIDELFIAHNDSEKIGIFRFEILNNLFLFVTSALIGHMYRVFYPVYFSENQVTFATFLVPFIIASIIGLVWALIAGYRQCRLKGMKNITGKREMTKLENFSNNTIKLLEEGRCQIFWIMLFFPLPCILYVCVGVLWIMLFILTGEKY
eukprot:475844_1